MNWWVSGLVSYYRSGFVLKTLFLACLLSLAHLLYTPCYEAAKSPPSDARVMLLDFLATRTVNYINLYSSQITQSVIFSYSNRKQTKTLCINYILPLFCSWMYQESRRLPGTHSKDIIWWMNEWVKVEIRTCLNEAKNRKNLLHRLWLSLSYYTANMALLKITAR
jgi:hypothetical protein